MSIGYTETVDQLVASAYLFATGKTTTLTFGSSKYVKILNLMNFFTQRWAKEADTNWASLRAIFTLASVVSATDTYPLPATIGVISNQEGDFVRIYHTDGINESDYTIVSAERLYNDAHTLNNGGINLRNAVGTCAQVGSSLIFSTPFTATSPQFGGTIKVPGFSIPPTLIAASDVVVIDDPQWLALRCAAEYVRTDITRAQLYPSLIDQANEAMDAMKNFNDSQRETVYTGSWSPPGDHWS